MKHPKAILYLILLIGIFFSCTEKKGASTNSPITVDIEKGLNFADTTLFSQPEFFQPEATEQSLIRDMTQIARYDSLIFIFDSSQDYIYIFNEQGKFLERAGKHGQGPEEYSDLYTFTVDPVQKELIVSTAPPLRLQFYSFDGELIAETPIPHYVGDMYKMGNKIIAENSSGEYLYEYTFNGHQLEKFTEVKIPPIKYNNFIQPEGNFLTCYHDTLFYTRKYDPTIYTIANGEATPFATLDFGPYKVTNENTLSMQEAQMRMRKVVIAPNNIRIKGHRMLFNALPFGLFMLDSDNSTVKQYGTAQVSGFSIKGHPILSLSQMQALQSDDNSLAAFVLDPTNIRQLIERADITNPKLKEILQNLNEDSNPILIFYHIR